MRRAFGLTSVVIVTLLGTLATEVPRVAAQADGHSLCAEALAAANAGATTFGPYRIVRAPSLGGSGRQAVLGTDGPDTLVGGSGDDLLCGFEGNDSLLGGSGNDIVVGGSGADRKLGGSGADVLHSDTTDSVVAGGSGRDEVLGRGPALTYAWISADLPGQCLLSYVVTGLQPGAPYTIEFDVANTGSAPPASRQTLSANSEGVINDVTGSTAPIGARVTGARVSDSAGNVVATASAGQVCGA